MSGELDQVLKTINQKWDSQKHQDDNDRLRAAVEAWVEAFDWPNVVVSHAMACEEEHLIHLGQMLFQDESTARSGKKSTSKASIFKKMKMLCCSKRNPGQRSDKCDHTNVSNEAMSNMEPKDYLLMALAFAAVGYAIYKLKEPRSQPANTKPAPNVSPDQRTLVLVVNASRSGVIDGLRNGVVSLDGDQLYQATQALWFGTATDFNVSKLRSWFDKDEEVAEPSEYDVYLVKIELDGDDRGLHRNANQMDRLDAFRRVRTKHCSVSKRLPSDAYGTTDVYSR